MLIFNLNIDLMLQPAHFSYKFLWVTLLLIPRNKLKPNNMNPYFLLLRMMFCFGLMLTFLSNQSVAQCNASFDYDEQDTVCINAIVVLTDQSTSTNGIGNITWTSNGNQFPSVGGSASFEPTVEGVYEIILEAFDVQFACSDRDTVTIVVLGNPIAEIEVANISCHGLCDGTAMAFYDSQNSGAYTATWSGGGTDPLADLCAGVYVADISDDFGCTAGPSIQGEIIEPDQLSSTISNGATILGCSGDPDIQLNVGISGGTPNINGAYNVLWSPASGISNEFSASPLLDPGVGNQFQIYTANITDDRGCTTSSNVQLLPSNSDVQGVISIGGTPCANCEVVFFKPQSTDWNNIFTAATNASGNYLFGNVPGQIDFRLMADPDDVFHPNVLQGFYAETGSTHLWEQATPLNSGCGAVLQKDIDLPAALQNNGQCSFRGALFYGATGKTQTEEDPIPLIDVVVEKTPPGSPQSKATTDINGEFEFALMESSATLYTLYVNMPGVPMMSTYEILVSPGDTLYQNLNLCFDSLSTEIAPCLATSVEEPTLGTEPSLINVYPNPNNGNFQLLMGSFEGEKAQVNVFDVSGRVVLQSSFQNAPREFQFSGLSKGYYLLRIGDGKRAESISVCVLSF